MGESLIVRKGGSGGSKKIVDVPAIWVANRSFKLNVTGLESYLEFGKLYQIEARFPSFSASGKSAKGKIIIPIMLYTITTPTTPWISFMYSFPTILAMNATSGEHIYFNYTDSKITATNDTGGNNKYIVVSADNASRMFSITSAQLAAADIGIYESEM